MHWPKGRKIVRKIIFLASIKMASNCEGSIEAERDGLWVNNGRFLLNSKEGKFLA